MERERKKERKTDKKKEQVEQTNTCHQQQFSKNGQQNTKYCSDRSWPRRCKTQAQVNPCAEGRAPRQSSEEGEMLTHQSVGGLGEGEEMTEFSQALTRFPAVRVGTGTGKTHLSHQAAWIPPQGDKGQSIQCENLRLPGLRVTHHKCQHLISSAFSPRSHVFPPMREGNTSRG